MLRIEKRWVLGLLLAAGTPAFADLPKDTPRPIPLTRPEMKELIESVKVREGRIPLPELTDEEKEAAAAGGGGFGGGGYEGRVRRLYGGGGSEGGRGRSGAPGAGGRREGGEPRAAGGGGSGGGFGRDSDPDMTLDNAFKVELFWIVSRANNCQYCLGHQESKLLRAGLSEDTIAALDIDWSGFTPAEQTAFAFARKFTYQPHLMSDDDIVGLKKFYTDKQILEMVLSMAGNNSINRWKEGVGVPQNRGEGGYSRQELGPDATEAEKAAAAARPRGSYLTPTSEAFATRISIVAPITVDPATGKPTTATVCDRPALESRQEVEKILAACKTRQSRLPLACEEDTRKALGDKWDAAAALPNWVRLLALFPNSVGTRAPSIRSADKRGDLSPLLKAQLSWIIARQDRAWYATGEAYRRLREQGQSDDQIFALDGDWKGFTPSEQALFTVAKNLGASPVVLTDDEVAKALEVAGPRDVVQTVTYTTSRASFNRITESAGLPIEP